jgi:transposase
MESSLVITDALVDRIQSVLEADPTISKTDFSHTLTLRDTLQDFSIEKWRKEAKACRGNFALWGFWLNIRIWDLMKAFAKGLRQDYAAVKAGITYEWSNGQVEGQSQIPRFSVSNLLGVAPL